VCGGDFHLHAAVFNLPLTGTVFSVFECQWENDVLVRIQASPDLCEKSLDHAKHRFHHPDDDLLQKQQHFSSKTTPHYNTQSPIHSPLLLPSNLRPFSPSLAMRHLTRHGTIDSPGGSMYVGEMQSKKSHGNGTRFFPDGSRYDGEWKEGVSRALLKFRSVCIGPCDGQNQSVT
jgi:hypothetical protein